MDAEKEFEKAFGEKAALFGAPHSRVPAGSACRAGVCTFQVAAAVGRRVATVDAQVTGAAL